MSENVLTLTDSSFDSAISEATAPVLVDFWAEWCGPCRMIAPILDEIAAENPGKVTIAKVNVDENQELMRRFQITSIPMLMLFKDGEPARPPIVGAKPKSALMADIQPYL